MIIHIKPGIICTDVGREENVFKNKNVVLQLDIKYELFIDQSNTRNGIFIMDYEYDRGDFSKKQSKN